MGVHIDSDEFERLARELADRRGTTVDQALTDLVRRELERDIRLSERRETVGESDDQDERRAQGFALLEERIALLPSEERDERRRSGRNFLEAVWKVQREIAALPVLDPRPIDELLYDEDGLPR